MRNLVLDSADIVRDAWFRQSSWKRNELQTQVSAIMSCMTMLPGPFYQGYRGRIWRTVVVALALLVIGGSALAGYRPAQYTFDVIHRFAPILYWAFFILFLLSLVWPKPK
jgi:hypothetical protein